MFLNSFSAAVRAIEAQPAGSSAYKPVAFHQRAAGVLIVVGFVHTATSYVEWSSDTAFAELLVATESPIPDPAQSREASTLAQQPQQDALLGRQEGTANQADPVSLDRICWL